MLFKKTPTARPPSAVSIRYIKALGVMLLLCSQSVHADESLLGAAAKASSEQRFDTAETHLRAYLELDSTANRDTALMALAGVLQAQHKTADSRATMQQLVQEFPRSRHAAQARRILASTPAVAAQAPATVVPKSPQRTSTTPVPGTRVAGAVNYNTLLREGSKAKSRQDYDTANKLYDQVIAGSDVPSLVNTAKRQKEIIASYAKTAKKQVKAREWNAQRKENEAADRAAEPTFLEQQQRSIDYQRQRAAEKKKEAAREAQVAADTVRQRTEAFPIKVDIAQEDSFDLLGMTVGRTGRAEATQRYRAFLKEHMETQFKLYGMMQTRERTKQIHDRGHVTCFVYRSQFAPNVNSTDYLFFWDAVWVGFKQDLRQERCDECILGLERVDFLAERVGAIKSASNDSSIAVQLGNGSFAGLGRVWGFQTTTETTHVKRWGLTQLQNVDVRNSINADVCVYPTTMAELLKEVSKDGEFICEHY